jgi:ribose transport system permease protein
MTFLDGLAARLTLPGPARIWAFVGKYGTIMGFIVMIAAFSLAEPRAFPTFSNLRGVLSQVALTAIIAGGMTFVLVVGEFDLSLGYQASLAGVVVVGLQVNQHLPMALAIILVLVMGAAIGAVNGMLVTKLGVNALIATLGTGTIVVGLSYGYTGGIPVALPPGSPFGSIALGSAILGIPNVVIIAALVLAVLWVILNRTDIGQRLQAVGGNREAAALSGVRVDRYRTLAFMIASVCAAITGMLLASRIGSGQVTGGDGFLLDSFAACFLGSAVLRDGVFHIGGTLIGVLIVGVGYNGLAILGVPVFFQFIFKGGLLIAAVALSTVARRYSRTR